MNATQRTRRSRTALFRLSVLTFFIFFGAGAVVPIMGLYLTRGLRFSGSLAGAILSLAALGVFVAPAIGSVVADRFVSAERLLGFCLLGSALFMFLLSNADSIASVTLLFAGYSLMFGPVMSLNNAVIFHHIERRGGDYGRIRVFGTLGWIAVAWLFSWFWLRAGRGVLRAERLGDALVLSAVVYASMGVFGFFLPRGNIYRNKERPGFIPRDAFSVVFKPEILALTAAVFLCILTDRFYYYGAAIFLKQSGFDESRILPVLSLGQILEIPAMAYLGRILARFGAKKVLVLGLLCNGCRYLLFTFSSNRPELIIAGIVFHGLTYAFFFSTALVCLDAFVKPSNRAGVHQLFTVISSGVGTLVGNLLAGLVYQHAASPSGASGFRPFWMICLAILIAALVCVASLFHGEKGEAVTISTD
ncbi:MAG: MFS transporter [Deltaproteobacteria bacterium]|nr:MFS transporter [Deltaproteobacteria bacterium]